MVYIGNDVVYSSVARGAAGWIWRHQSLLLPHFRSNVVTRSQKRRDFKTKTKKALEELFHRKVDNRLSAVGYQS